MFGESESESPRVPSPVAHSYHQESVTHSELIPRLIPESDDRNVEYKLQFLNPSYARFARLVTQLKWRLLEGGGQAYYELDVADSGDLIGLPREELEQSLEMMVCEIGASVVVMKEVKVPVAFTRLARRTRDRRRIANEDDDKYSSSSALNTETEGSRSASDLDDDDLSGTVVLERFPLPCRLLPIPMTRQTRRSRCSPWTASSQRNTCVVQVLWNGLATDYDQDPLLMRLPVILGAPFMLFILGLGLEIVCWDIETEQRLIIPNAVLWRELDWMVGMYQPFLVLAEGNAKAEQSVLLNYVELGPILTVPRALKYKHRLAFISAITASITYRLLPVFQIRTIENEGRNMGGSQATSLETAALAPDIDTLQAFVAGAGYADAAVIHNMTDPKFITGGWSIGRFDFPLNSIEGRMRVETVSMRSNANYSNPISQRLALVDTSFNLSIFLSIHNGPLDFGTPVNTALLVYILYSVQRIIFPSTSKPTTVPNEFKAGYSWMPMTHPPTVLFKTLTPQTLEPFNGKDGGRILLAINGIVFDVTAGRNYYGPNGMYGNFAGRDTSREMAKQSFDLGPFLTSTPNVAYPVAHDIRSEMLTLIDQTLDKLEDLQSDEVENMKGWIDHFSNKYIVCGKLVENGQA